MKQLVYRIALFLALGTLCMSLLSGKSIITTLERSALVYLGTMLIFFIFAHLMQWGMLWSLKSGSSGQTETLNTDVESNDS